LSTALTAEIRFLSPKDQLLLSLYYLQNVPLNAIGRHFGVHEATASRWLSGIRRRLRRRVEKALRRKHGLSAADIQSVWQRVTEEEGFSLSGLLPLGKGPARNSGK
jgi:hypothetical protein